MKLIDTHAHLDLLDDPMAAFERAKQAGVGQIITVGIDLESSRRAADFSRDLLGVFCTVGLHPSEATKASPDLWAELKLLALTVSAVAVGECGLDYYRDRSPRHLQREVFNAQIELALDLGLPLVVHDREAHKDVLNMLAKSGAERVGGVVHCFSGDAVLAEELVSLGFSLGITGVITYKKSDELRALVKKVPLTKLLIETDCPYLSPEPYRGKPNEPAYVTHTHEALAKALGISAEEVGSVTTDNARRLFSLPYMEE
ncbi:MAG: TatD family hydrolase [Deltaproteobacteria bacterium]|nr:TatD family hydrolase [Deltaproteobacteria bacterium]